MPGTLSPWSLFAVLVALGCADATGPEEHGRASSAALVAEPQRVAFPEESRGVGRALALSGDTALIGTDGGTYVSVQSESTWSAPQLLGQGATALAVSDDTALVGLREGALAYAKSGPGWTEPQALSVDMPGPFFGGAVALSGDRALVGDGGSEHPAAYVYVRNGATWSLETTFTPGPGDYPAFFGTAVALSGDTALVGSWQQEAVYVFVRNGTTWTEQQKLTPIQSSTVMVTPVLVEFGVHVALSGDTALVAADSNANGTGAAFVFRRSGNEWKLEQRLTASDGAEGDRFGVAVALSDDLALVGSQQHGGHLGGAVYVFARGTDTWSQQEQLVVHDEAPDGFGSALALSGRQAIIGAPYQDLAVGAAYVYDLSDVTAPPDADVPDEPPTIQLEQERPGRAGCAVSGNPTRGAAAWLSALLGLWVLALRRRNAKRSKKY